MTAKTVQQWLDLACYEWSNFGSLNIATWASEVIHKQMWFGMVNRPGKSVLWLLHSHVICWTIRMASKLLTLHLKKIDIIWSFKNQTAIFLISIWTWLTSPIIFLIDSVVVIGSMLGAHWALDDKNIPTVAVFVMPCEEWLWIFANCNLGLMYCWNVMQNMWFGLGDIPGEVSHIVVWYVKPFVWYRIFIDFGVVTKI